MHANIDEHKSRQVQSQNQSGERPLAPSAFSGAARLRELEHLADTARKVRDQAAAELTRGSGATHHVARERVAVAERTLRKAQQEIAELRARLNPSGTGAAQIAITAQDFELAVLLGHNKGRFNQVGDAHAPLELQQEVMFGRQAMAAANAPSRDVSKSGGAGKRAWAFSLLLVAGLGLGAFGTYAMFGRGAMADATQVVRDGTTQLIIRLRALLPSTDAGDHSTAKAVFGAAGQSTYRHPI